MSASHPEKRPGGEAPCENRLSASKQRATDQAPVPKAERGAAYDYFADLRLHDEEIDPLDERCESVEEPAPIQMRRVEFDPAIYDFRADLVLHDEEEEGLRDAANTSVPVVRDAQQLTTCDFSTDLRLQAADEPALPYEPGYDPAALQTNPEAGQIAGQGDALAEFPLVMTQQLTAESAAGTKEYDVARDLEIEPPAEEDYLLDLPTKRKQPAEVCSARTVAAASSLDAGVHSDLAAVAESAIAARLVSARDRESRGRGRGFRRPAGHLSWLLQLETWLVVASLSLFFQLFPAAFWRVIAVIDVRNWTWGVWVGAEISVIVVLLLLRVRPAADA